MGLAANMGASALCPAGAAPVPPVFPPVPRVMVGGTPVSVLQDAIPFANTQPFGICTILTSMALGVPTPCTAATTGVWQAPCPTVLAGGEPVVKVGESMALCGIGPPVTITIPGQVQVMVGG